MNAQVFIRWCVDTLFPPNEDALLVRCTTSHTLKKHPRSIDGVTTLLSFSEPHVRACIHEAKFSGNSRAQRLLAHALETYLPKNALIIPVPLSAQRKRERGYNQIAAIARYTSHSIEENTLVRAKNTRPQTDLARKERLCNVENAFRVQKKYVDRVQNKHVILLDDVVTTGATLRAAQKALAFANPASVTCVALAH